MAWRTTGSGCNGSLRRSPGPGRHRGLRHVVMARGSAGAAWTSRSSPPRRRPEPSPPVPALGSMTRMVPGLTASAGFGMPRARPDASSATVSAVARPTAAVYMLVVLMVFSFGGNMHSYWWPSEPRESTDGAPATPHTHLSRGYRNRVPPQREAVRIL